ncbi:MAG: type II toxin-antitoxin system VapC family toxin [Planctomycetota bacterium]
MYLETSVVGYATSRPSRSVIVAGHQQITRDWFARKAPRFALYVSRLVVTEATSGDEAAVQRRTAFLAPFPLLAITDAAQHLMVKLLDCKAVPRKASEDALHIAVAAVHGVSYLLTWNCRHIANAAMRQAIDRACRMAGYEPPVICTPEELMNDARH